MNRSIEVTIEAEEGTNLAGQEFTLDVKGDVQATVTVPSTFEGRTYTTTVPVHSNTRARIVPVQTGQFPTLERLSQSLDAAPPPSADAEWSTEAWTQEQLDAAIAADLGTALALENLSGETRRRKPTPVAVRVRTPGDEALEAAPVVGLTGETRGRLRTRIRVAAAPTWVYGWGTTPGQACDKRGGLPRRCLPRRIAVDPGIPSFEMNVMFKYELARHRTRRELFGKGLTHDQIEDIRRFYSELPTFDVRRLEWGMVSEVIEAHSQELTSQEIQLRAHEFYQATRAEEPVPQLLDDDLVKTLFRGLRPAWPKKDGEAWAVEFDFSAYERKTLTQDEGYVLPNVKVGLDAELKSATYIEYDYQLGSPRHRAVPSDGDAWTHAKRCARLAAFLSGQYEVHVNAHLLLEALAMAVHRCFQQRLCSRELLDFLSPFIDGVSEINNYGLGLIFEAKGVLEKATGLSSPGALAYVQHCLGQSDWKDYAPRSPVAGHVRHQWAPEAKGAWDFAKAYVREHMPRVSDHEDGYKALVAELFTHSVPCTAPESKDAFHPAVHSEIPGPPNDPDRMGPGGVPKALSRIRFGTSSTVEDVEHFLTYFVYQATFLHSHANDAQLIEGGDLFVAPLGFRLPFDDEGRPVERVPTDPQDYWDNFALRPEEAAQQLFLAEALSALWNPKVRELTPLPIPIPFIADQLSEFAETWASNLEDRKLLLSKLRRAPSV